MNVNITEIGNIETSCVFKIQNEVEKYYEENNIENFDFGDFNFKDNDLDIEFANNEVIISLYHTNNNDEFTISNNEVISINDDYEKFLQDEFESIFEKILEYAGV